METQKLHKHIMTTDERLEDDEVVFTADQGLAILKHLGEYDHIELIDKELISEWVKDRIDDNFVLVIDDEDPDMEKFKDEKDQEAALAHGQG